MYQFDYVEFFFLLEYFFKYKHEDTVESICKIGLLVNGTYFGTQPRNSYVYYMFACQSKQDDIDYTSFSAINSVVSHLN